MTSVKTLLSLFSAIAVSTLCPLSAHAEPKGFVQPAACGGGDILAGFFPESNKSVAFPNGQILKATVPPGADNDNGGMFLSIIGLKPPGRTGVAFDKLEFKADAGNSESTSFVVLFFDFPGNAPDERRVIPFSQLSSKQVKDTWKTYSIQNKDISGVTSASLKKVAFLVRQDPNIERTLKVGVLTVFHKNEDNARANFIKFQRENTCGLLPN